MTPEETKEVEQNKIIETFYNSTREEDVHYTPFDHISETIVIELTKALRL